MKSSSAALMARSSSQDFTSNSKRHFHWTKKVGSEEEGEVVVDDKACSDTRPSRTDHENSAGMKKADTKEANAVPSSSPVPKRKLQAASISRLRSVLSTAFRSCHGSTLGLGPRVVGTLFGHRKGHVHFALQKDPASQPALLIELATPISGVVREMTTSGQVRIALECDKPKPEKRPSSSSSHSPRLLEEPVWRTYCNGKQCGFAARRECGPWEWRVLKAVEMISMGAGVLPAFRDGHEPDSSSSNNPDPDPNGDVMYMRAKFERIVGSRDCEAFYMMNPDSKGAPELSIYLLRV